MDIDPAWLAPTWFLDFEHDDVREFATRASRDATDPMDIAIALFYAVRDGIRYDPYSTDYRPEAFRASTIVRTETNWCVPKSILLAASARSLGIPARLGFADVRNHLTSAKLTELMGTDVFVWHGYAELALGERWFKLSTAFNIELCERFGTKPLEFDGSDDALMHPFDQAGNRHMEYINQRGSYADLPLEEMLNTFREVYGTSELAAEFTTEAPGGRSAEDVGDDAFRA